ncbi:MAG: outer membrane protein assembly factor BamD [Pyrinomonadaceae bacterium]
MRRELARRGGLSPARLRILRLRRSIRLRRKLRRAAHAPAGHAPAPCARDTAGVKRTAPRASAFCLFLFALAACAGAAWGCGWNGFENSVRFGFNSEGWRTRLPPLPSSSEGSVPIVDDGLSYEEREAEVNELWDDAGRAVAAGELEKARLLLNRYVERTGHHGGDWRNSALDYLDALAATGRGSRPADVRSYIEARAAYDKWEHDSRKLSQSQSVADEDNTRRAAAMENWPVEVEARLAAPARDPNLADNAAYLRAVGVYLAGVEGDACEAFESVARRHPRGEKREVALFMAGRVALGASAVYLEGESATTADPCREPECRDEAWARARKNFTQLLADYPRGRYASDARGWLAYLDYRVGDTAGALAWYYRMLADEGDAGGRDLAAISLRLVRRRAGEADLDALERDLEDEPEAALTYAYHSVYNYAAGNDLPIPDFSDKNPYKSEDSSHDSQRWEEQTHAQLRGRIELAELRRAADFASRMVARHPGARAGGAFLVRLAGAQLELGRPKPALEAARRALVSGLSGEERARALWAEGVASYRLRDYAGARKSLGLVVAGSPRSEMARRAGELAASAAEEMGDLAGALEQYLALGYDPDVAYFVDVLMTPDQLASFVARQDASPRRDELFYALGLRFMRAGRYTEARAALSRIRTSADDYSLSSQDYNYYDTYSDKGPGHPKLHLRHTYWYEDGEFDAPPAAGEEAAPSAPRDTRVYADWLLRDMQTLSTLERLQADVERARGDEEKAEALYQLASYFYEGELLFYNPAAWRGMRATMIGSLGESNYRAPAEAQTIWAYVQEHEGAARAVALYLEVVRLYPRTRAARDSLYTAILCHQRLSDFNGYWRDVYARGQHAGLRLVTLADLRREYPQYRMPVVGDWKPSTRTVDGREAWPAPPKPPRLTGVERARVKLRRAELRVEQAWGLFGEVYGGRVRRWTVAAFRWSVVGLVALFVLGVFRRTRRARRFLYRRLVRHLRRPPAPRAVYAPTSTYAAHHAHAPLAGLREAAARASGGLLRLALHERGRAALALNLFTHGLLTVLLWAVLWASRQ